MSNTTRGPWHVNAIFKGRIVGDETTSHPVEKYYIGNANATVASVYRPADARLIAAAPDLYEAAKHWASVGACLYLITNPAADCACDWHLCARAVAKAEGRP